MRMVRDSSASQQLPSRRFLSATHICNSPISDLPLVFRLHPPLQTRRCCMAEQLRNTRVAALVDQGFEQSELLEPRKALQSAGAQVDVVSPQSGKVKGWQHTDWGQEVPVDRAL